MQDDCERYSICRHTLMAARRRRPSFENELRVMFGNQLTKADIARISDAALRSLTELDDDDMPEIRGNVPLLR